jgi:hypothetical protein
MPEQEWRRETLLTIPMSHAEARVVRANARARGLSMSAFVRQLLKGELVDLAR